MLNIKILKMSKLLKYKTIFNIFLSYSILNYKFAYRLIIYKIILEI